MNQTIKIKLCPWIEKDSKYVRTSVLQV